MVNHYPTLDSFFEDIFGELDADKHALTPVHVMKTDVVAKGNNYEMYVEMPGVKKEDIQMDLKDGYLTVKAEYRNKVDEKDEEGKIIRKERSSGTYSRRYYVGKEMTVEDIKATFENGELIITVPQVAPKKKEEIHTIPIM